MKRPPRLRDARHRAAALFGTWGLVVAVPLLLTLGPTEAFFAAHGAGRAEVLLFAAVVALVPPALLTAIVGLVTWIAPGTGAWLLHILVGILLAAAAIPFSGLAGVTAWAAVAAFVAVAVAIAALHARRSTVRRFVRWTAVAPSVVIAWFLLLSAVSGVVLPATAVGGTRAGKDANVLYVIFDELPLAALLDEESHLNADRFPAIAELASRGTWYPNVTTVSRWTHLAVPAMLSGRLPSADATSSRYYAHNVFAMLAPTHDVVAMELVTQLCPEATCETDADTATMFDDAFIVYGHSKLPRELAERWLPDVGDRWSNFRTVVEDSPLLTERKETRSERDRFDRLLTSIAGNGGTPTAWVAHLRVPHMPLTYLPDGRTYPAARKPVGLIGSSTWSDDQDALDVARQRFLLQVRYVDRLVGRLIGTLEDAGIFDETMIVVTSDHGIAFRPGHRRALPADAVAASDTYPVPLLIKYPNQTDGWIDPREGQVTDITPTIADALDVDLPGDWSFDGRSLGSTDMAAPRPFRTFDGEDLSSAATAPNPADAAERYLSLFGTHERHDVFAWGPHRALLGGPAPRSAPSSGVTGTADLEPFRADGDAVPAYAEFRFDRPVDARWFAVAVNGRIAGLGRVYGDRSDRGMVMVDPSFLRVGTNAIEGFLISDGSLERIDLAVGAGWVQGPSARD